MPNCSKCGKEIVRSGWSNCSDCNKEYKKKNSLKRKKQARIYYIMNKDTINEQNKKWRKDNKFIQDTKSSEEKRHKALIRQRTRTQFPIKNKKCNFCKDVATQHHHNTEPYKVDKFDYVCVKCHSDKEFELKCKKLERGGN